MIAAAIYARKSTEQKNVDAEARSCATQIANARAFALERGWSVDADHVYFDDAVSGADTKKLKARQQLLDVIKRGAPFQVLIVREQSRFSRRDGDEAFTELKQIARAGVEVWFYRDRTRFAYGTFGDNILGFVKAEAAAEYRRQIAGWTYDGLAQRARRGFVVGGRCFGYDNIRLEGHVERRINVGEAAVVRRIFELAAAGAGKTGIARQLNASHAIAPRPQQQRPAGWAATTVREVLFRDLYRGVVVWNRTKKRNLLGEVQPADRPESEWFRVAAPELRIVSDELWTAAHARLETRRRLYLRGTEGRLCGRPMDGLERKYLLVGLARCNSCGGAVEVNSRRDGRERKRFYGCATHHRRGAEVCSGLDVVPMQQVDEAVLETLAERLLAPDRIERVCRDVVAHFADPARNPAARRPELLKRRAELEAAISRLVDAIAAGGECVPLVARIKALEQDRASLDQELAAIEATGQPVVTMHTMRKALDRLFVEWKAAIQEGAQNVALARQAVQKLIDRPIEFTRTVRDGRRGVLVRVSGSLLKATAVALDRDEGTVARALERRPSPTADAIGETPEVGQQVASPNGTEDFFTLAGSALRAA